MGRSTTMPFAALLLCAHLAGQATEAGRSTVVLTSAVGGATEPARALFDDAARRAVQAAGAVVQAKQNTAEHLAEAKTMGIACEPTETVCAARFGALAGVRDVVVVVPRPGADGATFDVELVLVDVARQAETASVRARGVAASATVPPDLDDAAVRLIAPARWVGVVDVRTGAAGAEVRIDGAKVGTTPLAGPLTVAPGPHVVEVRAPGRAPLVRQATVQRGQRIVLMLDIDGAAGLAGTVDAAAPGSDDGGSRAAPLVWTGAGFLLGGLVVSAAAVAGVAAVELALAEPRAASERRALAAAGQVAVGAAVTAALVGVAGAGVLTAGLLGVGAAE